MVLERTVVALLLLESHEKHRCVTDGYYMTQTVKLLFNSNISKGLSASSSSDSWENFENWRDVIYPSFIMFPLSIFKRQIFYLSWWLIYQWFYFFSTQFWITLTEDFKKHGRKRILSMFFLSLTLSQTTSFRVFQIERVCRQQFLSWWQKVFQMDRKHCGKRRNCSLRAISPFPTVFSKGLYCRHVKTRASLGKG